MSGARARRLESDYKRMCELDKSSNFISFACEGDPPEKYAVTFRCKGIMKRDDGSLANSVRHTLEIYLTMDYPMRQPQLKWMTPVFHPNILGATHPYNPGTVCLGSWVPSMFLDDLCIKLGEMIQYKNFSLNSPLDAEAAVWANKFKLSMPVDDRPLLLGSAEKCDGEGDDEFDIIVE